MFLILLLAIASPSHSATVFPNIGYLFRGYHLYHASPLATQVSSDPGFLGFIYEPTYKKDLASADLKYTIPDGTKVYPKVGCSSAFGRQLIQSSSSYQELLRDIVKTNYSQFDPSFRGSDDFQRIHQSHSDDASLHTYVTQFTCVQYEAVLDVAALPPYSSMFVGAVQEIISNYQRDSADYDLLNKSIHGFLNTYGTHYVKKIDFGTRLVFQKSFGEEEREELRAAGVELERGAVLSMSRRLGHTLTEEELRQSYVFDKLVPGGYTFDSNAVLPLYYEVERMDTLFVKRMMKTAGVNYKLFAKLLSTYMADYCNQEKKILEMPVCDEGDLDRLAGERNFKLVLGGGSSGLSRDKLPEMDAFTVAFWLRRSPTRAEQTLLNVAGSDGTALLTVIAEQEESGGCVAMEIDATRVSMGTCALPFDGNFHHYVLTWGTAQGRWQIYVDGHLLAGGTAAMGFVLHSDSYLYLGQEGIAAEFAHVNLWDFAVNGVEARVLGEKNPSGNAFAWSQDKVKVLDPQGEEFRAVLATEEFIRV